MRPLVLVPILGASLALAACAPAQAAPDPARDVDCSVLAFWFARHAERTGAPADQRHAANVVHHWYSARARAAALRQGAGGVLAEAEPILAAVNRDPMAMRGAYVACADRAIDDPAFDAFAAREASR